MPGFAAKTAKPAPVRANRTGQDHASTGPQVQVKESETTDPKHIHAGPEVQPKIKVGAADDPAEREADQVAQQVVQSYRPTPTAMGEARSGPRGPSGNIPTMSKASLMARLQAKWNPVAQREAAPEIQPRTEEEVAPKEELKPSMEPSEVQASPLAPALQMQEEVQEKEEEAQPKEEEVQSKEELNQTAAEESVQEKAAPMEALGVQMAEEEEAQLEEDELQSREAEESVMEKAAPPEEAQPQVVVRSEEEEEAQMEAEELAPEVDMSPEPEVMKVAEQIQEEEEEEAAQPSVQRQSNGKVNRSGGETSARTEREIRSRQGGGQALPDGVRDQMETGIGADFSDVRIHTDPAAAALNQQLGARAFAFGADVFFGEGEFNPGTPSGDFLIAHELAHTVQQGAAPKFLSKTSEESEESIQASFRDVLDALLDAADWLGIDIPRIVDGIPGYTLFSYIIEYDVIRGSSVEQDMRGLIRGLMGIIPFGNLVFEKLDEYGLIDRAANFVETELSRLNLSLSRIENTISSAWDEMGVSLGISGNLRVLDRHFTPLFNDVKTFAGNVSDTLLDLVKEAVVRPLVDYLDENSPAYQLATKVIGSKFPLEDKVEAPTVEILRDFLILIGKETEVAEMEEKGTLQETADWIDTQLAQFLSLLGRFNAIVTTIWNAFTLETLADLPGVFQQVWNDFTELLQDFLDFALEVAAKVLELIKNALLEWLSGFANEVPGFHLMTVILGRNPFTGEEVPRTTQNIIRGFMGLVPGGEAKYQELEQTGVVSQAAAKIDALISELGISLDMIVGIFTGIWNELTIDNLVQPIETFQRIVDAFGDPIARLFIFVAKVVIIVVELVLRMMNFPIDLIGQIIENTRAAFEKIKEDPVQFLINLLNAVKLGFTQFFNNIITHLLNGLQAWLFGTLGEAGITIPQDLSLQSILGMAMEVLGITVDNVLERLALKIGQERVDQIRGALDTLTGIWEFVKDVIERGPIAIWEYVQEKLNDLWSMLMGAIQNWIMTRIITAVTTKILSMLDPTGIMAVINSAIAFYNAVMSFIEKLREILEIINTFVRGVLDIANGNIQNAANFLEQALADGIPVAISFLARQVGLGGLSSKIQEMIESAREKINEAIDWLIDKAMEAGTAFLEMIGMGGSSEEEQGSEAEGAEAGEEIPEVEDEFTFGRESHELSIRANGGSLVVMMASNHQTSLEVKIDRLRELAPLFESPGSNYLGDLNAILDQAAQLVVNHATQSFPNERARSTFLNQGLDQIGQLLHQFAENYGLSGIDGITNYQSPPNHAPSYTGTGYDRGLRTEVTLSYKTRPHMRSTNSQGTLVSGIAIAAGYNKGHLLAASLGGSNSDWKNYGVQSRLTNVSIGGMSNWEQQMRAAINDDGFPPWIIEFSAAANYDSNGKSALQAYLNSLGPADPMAAENLFQMAQNTLNQSGRRLTEARVRTATGLSATVVQANFEQIRREFLLAFTPGSFSVNVGVLQQPDFSEIQSLPSPGTLDNHR